MLIGLSYVSYAAMVDDKQFGEPIPDDFYITKGLPEELKCKVRRPSFLTDKKSLACLVKKGFYKEGIFSCKSEYKNRTDNIIKVYYCESKTQILSIIVKKEITKDKNGFCGWLHAKDGVSVYSYDTLKIDKNTNSCEEDRNPFLYETNLIFMIDKIYNDFEKEHARRSEQLDSFNQNSYPEGGMFAFDDGEFTPKSSPTTSIASKKSSSSLYSLENSPRLDYPNSLDSKHFNKH